MMSQNPLLLTLKSNPSSPFNDSLSPSSKILPDESEHVDLPTLYDDFDLEGIDTEDLIHWSQAAPEGQKLEDAKSHEKDASPESFSSNPNILKQLNHFVRKHKFFRRLSLTRFTTSDRRKFERDVYDFGRSVGLSKRQAREELSKARAFCGERDHDSDNSAWEDEVDDSLITLGVSASAGGELLPSMPSATQGRRAENHERPNCDIDKIGIGTEISASASTTSARKRKSVEPDVAIVSDKGHVVKKTRQDVPTKTGTQYDNATQNFRPPTTGRSSDIDEDQRRLIRKEKKKIRRSKMRTDSISDKQPVPKKAQSSNKVTQPVIFRKTKLKGEKTRPDPGSTGVKEVPDSPQLEASASTFIDEGDTKGKVDMFTASPKSPSSNQPNERKPDMKMNNASLESIAKSPRQDGKESVTNVVIPSDKAEASKKKKKARGKRGNKSILRQQPKQGPMENKENRDESHSDFSTPMIQLARPLLMRRCL